MTASMINTISKIAISRGKPFRPLAPTQLYPCSNYLTNVVNNDRRIFSTSPPPPPPRYDDDGSKIIDFDDGIDSYTRTLMQSRHQGIMMNPNGLSQRVLPGGYIVKTNQKTGDKRMVGLERSMGYFWEMKVRNTEKLIYRSYLYNDNSLLSSLLYHNFF